MAENYLIRGARQLITLQGPAEARRGPALADLAIISDGALLVRNGIIREVGPTKRVENLVSRPWLATKRPPRVRRKRLRPAAAW